MWISVLMQPACLNDKFSSCQVVIDNHNLQYHQHHHHHHHCHHHDVNNNTVIILTNITTITTTTTINMIVKDTIMKKGNAWITISRFNRKIADSANS